MISRIGFAPFREGMEIAAGQAHWRETHPALVLRMPGIRRYWQNHALWVEGAPLLPWTGFDACSEFDFDDAASMDRCFASEAYYTLVAPDELVFVDKTRGGMLIAHRHGRANAAHAPFRLMYFHRLAPLRPLAALGQALAAFRVPASAASREYYLAVDGAEAGQRCAAYDAIDIIGFASSDAALRYAHALDARAERRALGGLVRGSDTLIAQRVRIC